MSNERNPLSGRDTGSVKIDRRDVNAVLPIALRDFYQTGPIRKETSGSGTPFYRYLKDWYGWSAGLVEQVIHEYKRFISLLIEDQHPVIPSAAIDKLWRLHQQFTESYDCFCRSILADIETEANTKSGAQKRIRRRRLNVEAALKEHNLRVSTTPNKYRQKYLATLGFYLESFGKPPMDIWGPEAAAPTAGW